MAIGVILRHMAEFDWVSARFECTLQKAFTDLLADVKADVDRINRLLRDAGKHSKNFESGSGGAHLIVTRSVDSRNLTRVEFLLEPDAIVVNPGSGSAIRATIRLSPCGQCRFVVDGVEMEPWQLRRLALERLFFE